MDSESLATLIARVAAGDERAFARLYDATSAQLFGVVLRMLRSRERAEDVLQEVYVRVWDSAGTYAPDKGAALGWLIAIARHRAIDALRRQRANVSLDDAPEAEALADPGVDALSQALASAEARRLRGCIDELDAKPRQCILFAYYDGLTQEQLAARLAAPLGTVKSWMRRSLVHLKECLER